MPTSRRRALGAALALGGCAVPWLRPRAEETDEGRIVEMTARRFAYEPEEITLKVGERIVVVVRSLDFVHGMNIPSLHRRYDLMPGLPTRVALHPAEPGVIEFLCDNFCGDGHESMSGRFIVTV